jgi:hypothetical protein
MNTFDVDEEVVGAVWERAKPKPFENLTFNSALRRVLGLPDGASIARAPENNPAGTPPRVNPPVAFDPLDDLGERSRSKAPKADLRQLVRAGLLRNGEELFLVGYNGERLQQYTATISGGGLQFKAQHYSMSDLARFLLKKVGYQSDSVRGPAHWANAAGVTVKDLWQQLCTTRTRK